MFLYCSPYHRPFKRPAHYFIAFSMPSTSEHCGIPYDNRQAVGRWCLYLPVPRSLLLCCALMVSAITSNTYNSRTMWTVVIGHQAKPVFRIIGIHAESSPSLIAGAREYQSIRRWPCTTEEDVYKLYKLQSKVCNRLMSKHQTDDDLDSIFARPHDITPSK